MSVKLQHYLNRSLWNFINALIYIVISVFYQIIVQPYILVFWSHTNLSLYSLTVNCSELSKYWFIPNCEQIMKTIVNIWIGWINRFVQKTWLVYESDIVTSLINTHEHAMEKNGRFQDFHLMMTKISGSSSQKSFLSHKKIHFNHNNT